MYTETTTVINKLGVHARPASDLTLKAKEFSSEITIRNLSSPNAKDINAKLIMKILAASISMGSTLEISADGDDEVQAVKALVAIIESGFLEE